MIQHDNSMIEDFSKHFNARLNLTDFLDAAPLFTAILNKEVPPNLVYPLTLPCRGITFLQLRDFGYQELLDKVLRQIKIISEAQDVYCSKIDQGTFELFRDIFHDELKKAKVVEDEQQGCFVIRCSQLVMDLIWSPISQFHGEVIIQLEYFERMIQLRSISASRENAAASLYLNSKVPTPFSYFILAFVAENLGIPLKLLWRSHL